MVVRYDELVGEPDDLVYGLYGLILLEQLARQSVEQDAHALDEFVGKILRWPLAFW